MGIKSIIASFCFIFLLNACGVIERKSTTAKTSTPSKITPKQQTPSANTDNPISSVSDSTNISTMPIEGGSERTSVIVPPEAPSIVTAGVGLVPVVPQTAVAVVNPVVAPAGSTTPLSFVVRDSDPDFAAVQFNIGTHDFGTKAVGTSTDVTILMANLGRRSATDIGLALPFGGEFRFKDDQYPGTGGTCGINLKTGESCYLVVSFIPLTFSIGNERRSSTLVLKYNDGLHAQMIELPITFVGTVQNPAPIANLQVSEQEITFGNIPIGGMSAKYITLTNHGMERATQIQEVASTIKKFFYFRSSVYQKPGDFPGVDGTCLGYLDPGQSCTLALVYFPTAEQIPSPGRAIIELKYFNGTQYSAVHIVCSGGIYSQPTVAAPEILRGNLSVAGPSDVDLGSVAIGSSKDYVITIANSGPGYARSITSGVQLNTEFFSLKAGTCHIDGGSPTPYGPWYLNPGDSCNYIVTYAPTAHNIGNAEQAYVNLTYFDGVDVKGIPSLHFTAKRIGDVQN